MAQNEMDEGQVICPCSGTRISHLRRYVERGIVDVTAISEGTGALSGCGGCEFDVLEALDFLKAQSCHDKAECASNFKTPKTDFDETEAGCLRS